VKATARKVTAPSGKAKVTSWSPSRYEKYQACPQHFLYEVIQKLCPRCFKGKLQGGFDSPAICDTCGETVEQGAALVRGSEVGESVNKYLRRQTKKVCAEASRHPKVARLLLDLHKIETGLFVEKEIYLDRSWRPMRDADKFSPKVWFRGRLDCLYFVDATKTEPRSARVIDWKTGGIDKRTGAIRVEETKYDDQLSTYNVGVLCAYPGVLHSKAMLAFLDCGPRFEPFVERPKLNLTRDQLSKAQAEWERKVAPLFADDVFAPKPSDHACRFCPFKSGNSGPCPY
jgi:hypothetical protein